MRTFAETRFLAKYLLWGFPVLFIHFFHCLVLSRTQTCVDMCWLRATVYMNGFHPWFLRLAHIAFDLSSSKDMSFFFILFPSPSWQSPTFLYTLLLLLSDHIHTTLLNNFIKQLLPSSNSELFFFFIFQTPNSLPTKLHLHVLLSTQPWVITTYFICGFVCFRNLKEQNQNSKTNKQIANHFERSLYWSVFHCASSHLPIHAHFWSLCLSFSFGVQPGTEEL